MPAPETRDYFAELYVAGLFGDAGWAVYFPKRDVGFDFIASKQVGADMLIRPVQVKGLYPTAAKGDRGTFGYRGELTAKHPLMVLALPYFHVENSHAPETIAYMPYGSFKNPTGGGVRCEPACFEKGHSKPRLTFKRYFDREGLKRVEQPGWGTDV